MPQILLNVVGVFYSAEINVGGGSTTTVKDVMDEAVKQSATKEVSFKYTSIVFDDKVIVNSITAYHRVPFKSRSGMPYPKGIYRLDQSFTAAVPNPYSVWQYYLFNENNGRIPVPGEQSFTVTKVEDADPAKRVRKIVWRLVTICNKPTGLSHRMQSILPGENLTDDLF